MDFKSFLRKVKDRLPKQEEPDNSPVSRESAPPTDTTSQKEADPVRKDAASGGISGLSMRRKGQQASDYRQGVVMHAQNDTAYDVRNEQVETIEAMFGDYGPVICSYILTQFFAPGGMKRLVEKLGMHSRGRDNADMSQVEAWLAAKGKERFMEVCRLRGGPPAPPAPEKKEDNTAAIARVKPISPTPVSMPQSDEPEFHEPKRKSPPPEKTKSDIQEKAAAPRPKLNTRKDSDSDHYKQQVNIPGIQLNKDEESE